MEQATTPDEPVELAADSDVALTPTGPSSSRIDSLDFIRGIAVMGILIANISGFGQMMAAATYPGAFATPHDAAEDWMWVAQFVLIDGKMRGLFTLLFGAGMYLFMERAWAKGRGRGLQVRRLLWLGAFGLAHFFLLWRGDILFLYAISGLIVLLFVKLSPKRQLLLGLIGYVMGGLLYMGTSAIMQLSAEGGFASAQDNAALEQTMADSVEQVLAEGRSEAVLIQTGSWPEWVAYNLANHWYEPLSNASFAIFETVPLMLIGMALYRLGLFEGRFDRRRQLRWGWIGLVVGVVWHVWIALQAKAAGLTFFGTTAAIVGWSHFPRLAMTLGLAAILSAWRPGGTGWFHERVSAAGRAAFTNYLGTSLLLLFVFHGWAGGLFGELSRGELYVVVLGMWAIMLAWSKPWLERYRYGPLEWLWRCLTYGRRFPIKR